MKQLCPYLLHFFGEKSLPSPTPNPCFHDSVQGLVAKAKPSTGTGFQHVYHHGYRPSAVGFLPEAFPRRSSAMLDSKQQQQQTLCPQKIGTVRKSTSRSLSRSTTCIELQILFHTSVAARTVKRHLIMKMSNAGPSTRGSRPYDPNCHSSALDVLSVNSTACVLIVGPDSFTMAGQPGIDSIKL